MSKYYVSRNTSLDETRELERQDALEQSEREAWEEKWMIQWTANSGHQISICLDQDLAGGYLFVLNVEGREQAYQATDIKPVSNVPGIVAKISNVGLTEERRNALRVIWKRRSEWISQP